MLLTIKDLSKNIQYFNDAICPSCLGKLKTAPLKKSNCSNCKSIIYSRKHPILHKKMLLNESSLNELSKYSKINEYLKITEGQLSNMYFLKEMLHDIGLTQEKYDKLKAKENSADDIDFLLKLYKKNLIKRLKSFDLGLYRNDLYSISKLLSYKFRFIEAIDFSCQVAYLDLNGVDNNMKRLDLNDSSRFGECIPNVINRIIALIALQEKETSLSNIERHFKNQSVNGDIVYALSLNEAWNILNQKFQQGITNFLGQ